MHRFMLPGDFIATLKNYGKTTVGEVIFTVSLSWFYALCSQIIVPLPFNFVPVSLQPLPVLLAAIWFGPMALDAYILYLFQGACGLPFFAGFHGGIARLLGPTGGYLIGFLIAMIFLHYVKDRGESVLLHLIKAIIACTIYFSFGCLQLAFFVPIDKLLYAGLYPFLVGDCIKTLFVAVALYSYSYYRKYVR